MSGAREQRTSQHVRARIVYMFMSRPFYAADSVRRGVITSSACAYVYKIMLRTPLDDKTMRSRKLVET